MLSLESVNTCVAEVGSTTFRLVRVSEYQAAYRTFCLKNTCRCFNKLAIVSSKCLLLCPAMWLCSSLSTLWYLGGCTFLLLSMYVCSLYVCMYRQQDYMIVRISNQVCLSSGLCSVTSLSALYSGVPVETVEQKLSRFRYGVKKYTWWLLCLAVVHGCRKPAPC